MWKDCIMYRYPECLGSYHAQVITLNPEPVNFASDKRESGDINRDHLLKFKVIRTISVNHECDVTT